MPAEKHRFEIQGPLICRFFQYVPVDFSICGWQSASAKGQMYAFCTMLYRALEHPGGSCNQFPIDTKGQLKFWESQKVYVDADFQLLRDLHPDSFVVQGSIVPLFFRHLAGQLCTQHSFSVCCTAGSGSLGILLFWLLQK